MVVNESEDIILSLQLIMNDDTPDTGATVTYIIVDTDLSTVVSSQTATYSTTSESYIDKLDVSEDWPDQIVGTYLIIWSISDTSDNFPSLLTEDLQINIDEVKIDKILGLVHQNIYIDETIYDRKDNLISARLRIYSLAASVGTDNDVLATYTITSNTEDQGKFTTWQQVEN